MFLHLSKILWESNKITLLVLYYISSRMVTLLKVSIGFNRNPVGARLQIDGDDFNLKLSSACQQCYTDTHLLPYFCHWYLPL
jgi:hypothetical protein